MTRGLGILARAGRFSAFRCRVLGIRDAKDRVSLRGTEIETSVIA